MSRFQAGDLVRHKKCPEWGVGEVMKGSAGAKVKALFERGGVKTVLADHLEAAPPDAKPPIRRPHR